MVPHPNISPPPFFCDSSKIAAGNEVAPVVRETPRMMTPEMLQAYFGLDVNIQRSQYEMLFINLKIFSDGYSDDLLDAVFQDLNGSKVVLVHAGGIRIDAQKPNLGRTLLNQVVTFLEVRGFFLSDCLVDKNANAFLLAFELNCLTNNSRFHLNEKFYDLEFFSPNDVMRVKSVVSNCFYEKSMLLHMGQNYSGGDIVDVGANVGNHSVYFSSICSAGCVVYAIEPGADALNILHRNIASNCLADTVCVLPYAAGELDGSVIMRAGSKKNLGAMRVVGVDSAGINSIPMKTIDNMIPVDRRVSLMKIDVEGFELPALKGSQRILNVDKPDIYIEAAKPEFLKEISQFLDAFGYAPKLVFNDTPTHWFKAI